VVNFGNLFFIKSTFKIWPTPHSRSD